MDDKATDFNDLDMEETAEGIRVVFVVVVVIGLNLDFILFVLFRYLHDFGKLTMEIGLSFFIGEIFSEENIS